MAATIKGKAVKWGVQGITFTAGIVSTTNNCEFQSLDLDRTSDKANVKNGAGDTVSQVFYDLAKTLRCTVVPSATGGAGGLATADSSVDGYTIAPGTTITVVDANGAVSGGSFNLISAKQRRTNSDVVMVDLEMENRDANTVTTTNT